MHTRKTFSTSTPPPASSRTRPYALALQRLSARTGTPLPSLIVSFGILHELTAIVPLAGVFFGARTFGAGEAVIKMLYPEGRANSNNATDGWIARTCRSWVDEGEAWAGRVGRRYGILGYQKGDKVDPSDRELSTRLAGDVANAVLAYGAVKAILPLRIGLSLWLSPAFSRRCVEPLRSRIAKLWPGNRD